MNKASKLLKEIQACMHCENELPCGANPVLNFSSDSKILIAGQAPGIKVHESGIPWDDASGKRLREWLHVSNETFYDPKYFAIVPMGFCYPGKGKSGDLPPLKICSELWHERILKSLTKLELIIVIGQYAKDYYLNDSKKNLTDLVKEWNKYDFQGIQVIVLPHPSARNNIWLKKNPWFEELILPKLRTRVRKLLK